MEVVVESVNPQGSKSVHASTPSASFSQEQDVSLWGKGYAINAQRAFKSSPLLKVIRALMHVSDPPMPFEAALPKALALVGCPLSREASKAPLAAKGVERAAVKIVTGSGQVANFFTLAVADSGSGKDIGRLETITCSEDWLLGTAGSAEGLKESLMEIPNGLLLVSEFEAWLSSRHWQSQARSFLTDTFSKGFFKDAMSSHGAKKRGREARFCYPNVAANIQPEVLARVGGGFNISSGFLNRFLIFSIPKASWRPTSNYNKALIEGAKEALQLYNGLTGEVNVPEGYLGELYDELSAMDAPFPEYWRRLINEYGPRLALVVAGSIEIPDEVWPKVDNIIRWLYGMAVNVFASIHEGNREASLEKRLRKILRFIEKHPGCLKGDISRGCHTGTTAHERTRLIDELVERQQIKVEGGHYFLFETK